MYFIKVTHAQHAPSNQTKSIQHSLTFTCSIGLRLVYWHMSHWDMVHSSRLRTENKKDTQVYTDFCQRICITKYKKYVHFDKQTKKGLVDIEVNIYLHTHTSTLLITCPFIAWYQLGDWHRSNCRLPHSHCLPSPACGRAMCNSLTFGEHPNYTVSL